MKTYSIDISLPIQMRELEVRAESPQEAYKLAKEQTDWQIERIFQLGDEEDECGSRDIEDEFEVVSVCDGCDKPILSGDKYFAWEDATTCEACGGVNESHKPIEA